MSTLASDNNFNSLISDWKTYIREKLLTIVKKLNVELEGNIFSEHLKLEETKEM